MGFLKSQRSPEFDNSEVIHSTDNWVSSDEERMDCCFNARIHLSDSSTALIILQGLSSYVTRRHEAKSEKPNPDPEE
jgi:hypothetical protein